MPELEVKDYITFLAMLISLVAVIIGPIITLKVAKRQIVSPIRQKWIDELREVVSEYLSECQQLIILGKDGMLNSEQTDESLFTRLLYLEQKLRLMLNPKEDNHNRLLEIIRTLTEDIHHGHSNLLEFGATVREATEATQAILKQEWIRVKHGDI